MEEILKLIGLLMGCGIIGLMAYMKGYDSGHNDGVELGKALIELGQKK